MFDIKSFEKDEIVEIINKELKKSGRRVKASAIIKTYGFDYTLVKTSRNARLVVQFVCHYETDKISVRAIHRIKDKFRPFRYLFNGQGGPNLDTLIFNGEQGEVYTAEKKSVAA